jgi:SAM-dependent methyltransferase
LYHGAAITAKVGVRTYLGTFESLKLPSNSLAAIGVFDVLEHLDNPEELLSEIYRVLKPGGQLLVSVPAHQWLFSDFDESIGHFRRYSKRHLSESLKKAGFIKTKTEFMFSIFVLPALILRKLPSLLGRKRKPKETLRSSSNLNAVLNRLDPLLKPLFFLERMTRLPFGLSLFSVSEKRL